MAALLVDPHTGLARVEPAGPVDAFKTYAVRVPMRPASCREFECDYWETGWFTYVDPRIQQGPERIIYLRYKSGRRFDETIRDDGIHVFWFYPHQSCFKPHQLPAAAEIFYRRDGDWRGNPTGERMRFANPDDWVDSFRNHTDRFVTDRQRG
jgi:hypothetical protein